MPEEDRPSSASSETPSLVENTRKRKSSERLSDVLRELEGQRQEQMREMWSEFMSQQREFMSSMNTLLQTVVTPRYITSHPPPPSTFNYTPVPPETPRVSHSRQEQQTPAARWDGLARSFNIPDDY